MEYVTRSHVEQIDPGLLPTFLKIQNLSKCLQTVATGALIYDALVTMDREVKYFWKIPRAPVDFVYFANRYIGILGAVAYLFCEPTPLLLIVGDIHCNKTTRLRQITRSIFAEWTSNITNWLTVVLTNYILTIRVLALYSRDRTLSIYLFLFLALEAALKLAAIIYVLVIENVVVGGADGLTLCGIDRIPPWQPAIVDWSVELAYGIVLMVLALYKAAEYWRLSNGFKGFTLVKVLIEDQVIYFMAVILVSVFAMLDFRLATSKFFLSAILQTLGNPSFLCVLGSRMLLNLKEAGERGQNEGTSFAAPSRTVSDIEFGEPPANVKAGRTEEIIGE